MMVADAPCPREYSLRPAVHFLLFQPGVFPRTECPFRQPPGCGKDSHCSSLQHLDLTTGATSGTPDSAFPTISGSNFEPETVLAVHASTATEATSLPTPVSASIGHRRLGHPNVQVMTNVKSIPECGISFSDT